MQFVVHRRSGVDMESVSVGMTSALWKHIL